METHLHPFRRARPFPSATGGGKHGRVPCVNPITKQPLRRGVALFLAALWVLWLAGIVPAAASPTTSPALLEAPPIFERQRLGRLGRAPDGRPVNEAAYTASLPPHILYFNLYFFGDATLPVRLAFLGGEEKEPKNYADAETGTILPARRIFLVATGGDGNAAGTLAPDGSIFTLREEARDIYYGDGADIRSRYAWNAARKTYILASREETSFSSRALDALSAALQSGERGRVLDALTALGDISGRSGSLYAYPPDDLVPDLWRYFERYARETARHDVKKAAAELATLLDACLYLCLEDPTSLEGFVIYSLKEEDVRPRVTACAALLEKAGEREHAADLRRGLASPAAHAGGSGRIMSR